MHERAVAGADELGPAVVDVLAQRRGRLLDLAVDGEVDEVLELGLVEASGDEAELQRRLLAALGEVALVEGEAQLAVLEDEVLSGVVVAAAGRIHGRARPRRERRPGVVGILRAIPSRALVLNVMLH